MGDTTSKAAINIGEVEGDHASEEGTEGDKKPGYGEPRTPPERLRTYWVVRMVRVRMKETTTGKEPDRNSNEFNSYIFALI